MLKKVIQTIKTYQMITDDKPIIVGVSGGPDSMTLLDILSKITSNRLIVAHLNHKFRGKDATDDANFVEEESKKRGVTAIIREFNVPEFMEKTGMGAQEAAREVRYQFYLDVAKEWDASNIALGHHANDQAETILMRILRGTGSTGLSGIPYIRQFSEYNIIRPLLDVSRDDIEKYCSNHSIPFRTDKSNFSTKYFRNEIRLEVLPYLMKYNQKIISHLHHLGKIIQDESSYLQGISYQIFKEITVKKDEHTYSFSAKRFQPLDIALQRRVIHLILRYLNLQQEIAYKHIEDILYLVHHHHPSKSLDLPGLYVYRNYDEIIFTNGETKTHKFSYILHIPGYVDIVEAKKRITAYISNTYEKPNGTWAVFDYEKMDNKALIIRSRENGDRIIPFGMEGTKKIKDILIDNKIPKADREVLPLVEYDKRIIWVPGLKRSDFIPINPSTTKYLYLVIHDTK